MSWTVRVRGAAERDIARASAWYQAEAPEQVERFLADFGAARVRIQRSPLLAPDLIRGARHVALRSFPYSLWYVAHEETGLIDIFAVIHHRQDRDDFFGRV